MGMESDDKKRWNEGAESWVEFVRSGKSYYSEYLVAPQDYFKKKVMRKSK